MPHAMVGYFLYAAETDPSAVCRAMDSLLRRVGLLARLRRRQHDPGLGTCGRGRLARAAGTAETAIRSADFRGVDGRRLSDWLDRDACHTGMSLLRHFHADQPRVQTRRSRRARPLTPARPGDVLGAQARVRRRPQLLPAVLMAEAKGSLAGELTFQVEPARQLPVAHPAADFIDPRRFQDLRRRPAASSLLGATLAIPFRQAFRAGQAVGLQL